MSRSRSALVVTFGLSLVLALTACGPGAPTPPSSADPSPSATSSGGPSPSSTADETPVAAASIVVTASRLSVFGTDGSTLVSANYDMEASAVAARIADALGVDPAVSSTTGVGSGCDSDQTMYDFGGFLLRSPGFIGTTGAYEAVITAPATSGGVVLETVGGQRVGANEAAFLAAVGETVLLGEYPAFGSYPAGANYGFDVINPEASEYEQVGAYANVVDGVLESFNAPYYFYADC